MGSRNYWLDLFTGTTWKEFLDAGGDVSGFREPRWKTVQKIKPGDYLLCYLTGVSRFIGILEVTSEAYHDNSPIWKDDEFPSRVRVKKLVALKPETAVPVLNLKEQLSIFKNLKNPHSWTGYFRGSPYKWRTSDGEVVVNALLDAGQNPVVRPVNPAKLARRPRALRAKIGSVTIPDFEGTDKESEGIHKEPTQHAEIQWTLLKLGNDLGLDVWVARNDRNREVNGNRFAELPNLKKELPMQFDEVTNRTIELIDVLWLKGNAIIASFEIESTTSIYSGLLRMSDLISMHPNLNIPLFLVAPDEKRDKVILEVNRPTFSKLSPPLSQICRYISFGSLKEGISNAGELIQYLKPDFLEEISETCEAEDPQ